MDNNLSDDFLQTDDCQKQLNLYHSLLNCGIFSIKINKDLDLLYCNDEFYSLIEYTKENFKKLLDNKCIKCIYKDDVDVVFSAIRNAIEAKNLKPHWFMRIATESGNLKYVEVKGEISELPDGTYKIDGIIIDKTQLRQNETALINQKKVTETVINKFAALEYEFISLINTQTGFTSTEFTNYSDDYKHGHSGIYNDLLKHSIDNMFFKSDAVRAYHCMNLETIQKKLEKQNVYTCIFGIKSSNQKTVKKKWQFTYIDESKKILAIARTDVTDTYNAETDPVSSLYNRAAFYHHTEQYIRNNPVKSFALIILDIDHFKLYNDLFGLKEGDRLLRNIADQILSLDIILVSSRLEADRFALLLEYNEDNINTIISDSKKWLSEYRSNYTLTSRYGAYKIEGTAAEISVLCDRALLALQSTKGNSFKDFAWYNESMRINLIEEQETEKKINTAFENDEFGIFLQPQYDTVSGELIGAEALARWFTNDGIVSPAKFIPVLERTDKITKLDLIIFEKVCILLNKWQKSGYPLVRISSNLSRHDIYNLELCKTLCAITDKYKIDHSMINLEITETAYMENPDQLISAISQLRNAGFLVEMDDFGSGYSSLNTLKDMPVDIIKLDLKFLSDNIDERGGIILNSVVQMAHWLNLRVIAEGVETAKQANYLKTIDCRFVQGYYFSRPVGIQEFEKLLTQQSEHTEATDISIPRFFDSKEFWNPDAQATVIFNTFVGAAGIFEYNGNSLYAIRLNDKFFEATGCVRDIIRQKQNILNMICDEHREEFHRMLDATRKSEEEFTLESRWNISKSNKIWLSITMRCIAGTLNKSVLYASIENITKRVELAQNNRKLNNELSGLVHSVPGGIVKGTYKDGKMTFTYASEGLSKMLGYTQEELISNYNGNLESCVHPDDIATVNSVIQKIVTLKQPFSCHYRVLCKSGKYLWVHMKSNPIGSVYYASFTDITSLKEMEQRALLEKEKSDFAIKNADITVWDYDIKTKACKWHSDFNSEFVRIISDTPQNAVDKGIICKNSVRSFLEMYQAIENGEKAITKTIHAKDDSGNDIWYKITYHTVFDNNVAVGATGFSVNLTENFEKERRYLTELHYLEEVHGENLIDKGYANITQNTMESYSASISTVLCEKNMNYRQIVDALINSAYEQEHKKIIEDTLCSENLIRQYNSLNKHIKITYLRVLIPGNDPIWSELTVKLYQDPNTMDIMAFLYSYNIEEKKILKDITSKIFNKNYGTIALLNPKTKIMNVIQCSDLEKIVLAESNFNYAAKYVEFINNYITNECKNEALKKLSIEHIIKMLEKYEKYSCSFTVDFRGKKYRRKWEFSYLNSSKSRIIYTCIDVTTLFVQQEKQRAELKNALNQAEKANNAKTNFLSNISHDIRTPLNAIINMARIARDDFNGTTDGNVIDDINKIETTSDFLLALINDILDMSKIDAGKFELFPEVYFYDEFLNYISCIFMPMCKTKKIKFVWDKGTTELPIYIDKVRFNQLFFNLLSNAVKYTPSGGTVCFAVKENIVKDEKLCCKFIVSDTGCGMSEEFQQKMFEPFEREYNIKAYTGTGLGLSIVKSITELMGGTVTVSSKLNEGTTITIYLQLQIATEQQIEEYKNQQELKKRNISLVGKNILIAEDNSLNMSIMVKILEKQGMNIFKATDGKEAVEMFEKMPEYTFDALLMDIRMPIMDGLEATRLIRLSDKKDAKTIPIIAITANAFDEDKKLSRIAGMSDYLTKPVNPDLLYETIHKHIK